MNDYLIVIQKYYSYELKTFFQYLRIVYKGIPFILHNEIFKIFV